MEILTPKKTPPSSSQFIEFWRKFRRNIMGLVGLGMLVTIILVALFAPVIAPRQTSSAQIVGAADIYKPPSAAHPFGTDDAGGDVFSNFIHGARVSLTVGFFAAFISIVIGGALGITAGFLAGASKTF
jgi:peptide/nickel transport system permease protein